MTVQNHVSAPPGPNPESARSPVAPVCANTATPAISVFRTLDELDALRAAWKDLCCHCAADIDFLKTIIAQRPAFVRPHVIVFSAPGSAPAMLIGRIEQRPWRIWLQPKETGPQPVSMLIVPEGGVLDGGNPSACKQLITEVMNNLRRGEFDVAMFGGLKTGTPLYDAVRAVPPLPCRDHGLLHVTHWLGHLPGTLDEFLRRISSAHRSIFRKKQRKLEAAHPGQVHFRSFTQPAEVEELDAAAAEIAQQTYQYRRGGSYRPSAEGKSFLQLSARNQWLRAYLLYVDKRPIAFWIGTLYRDTLRLDTTGYVQEFKEYDPGIILFLHMVGDLCKQGVKHLDFGIGESIYKSRFGDEKLETATGCMFAPTAKGVSLMALRCLRYSVENISRQCASHFGFDHPLRKFWRALPAALRMKQSVEVTLACLLVLISGTWQGWLKWPEGTLIAAALCLITSVGIVRKAPQKPPLKPQDHAAGKPS
ncbi:MAG: GNAT family N-acetyltransferase [Verrucomicrobia bacterium]|nr:GNAT family N-acetyltransferase [Verrucomicrobiota bacterium]